MNILNAVIFQGIRTSEYLSAVCFQASIPISINNNWFPLSGSVHSLSMWEAVVIYVHANSTEVNGTDSSLTEKIRALIYALLYQ